MRSRLEPAAVDLLGLFAQAERDAEFVAAEFADALQHAFDERRVRLGFELAGLQDHGAVALFETPARHADHVVLAQMIPFDERVPAPDAAVITIFRTLVAELDQTAQGDDLSDVAAFELVGSRE